MHPPLCLFAAACVLQPTLLAQSGASGSETIRSPARSLSAAGGSATSTGTSSETELALPIAGPVSTSANHRFLGGAVWTDNGYAPGGPIVFGVLEGSGTKDGGELEVVIGAGFQSAGALQPLFGDLPVLSTTVVSDSELLVQSPPGVDLIGNALGQTSVTVGDGIQSSTASDAYLYRPGILSPTGLRLGEPAEIVVYANPGDLVTVYGGASLPGIVLPLAGFDGAFDLLAVYFDLFGSTFVADGPLVLDFTMPTKLSLVGKTLQWQGSAIDSFFPLTGSFTNKLSLQIGA